MSNNSRDSTYGTTGALKRFFEGDGVTIVFVGTFVLAFLFIFSTVFTLFPGDDGYSKVYTSWTVGGITSDGAFDSDKSNLLCSDKIEITKNIKIELDYDSEAKYQLYFYDEDELFLGASEPNISSTMKIFTVDSIKEEFESAKYYRIVLAPASDDEYINIFEIFTYSGQITVYEKRRNQFNFSL